MTAISWGQTGSNTYQRGVGRGVLYLQNGEAIPWHGLTAVSETETKTVEPVYFEGDKIHDIINLGEFSASVTAITYPDNLGGALDLGSQTAKTYGFSYQTKVNEEDYKIHILYNVTFTMQDAVFNTRGSDPALTPFSWALRAPRIEIPGFAPLAEIIIDSKYINQDMLPFLEEILYGSEDKDPRLPPIEDFLIFLEAGSRISIVNNGDGTWTAIALDDGDISESIDGSFAIDNVNGTYSNAYTYSVLNTGEW